MTNSYDKVWKKDVFLEFSREESCNGVIKKKQAGPLLFGGAGQGQVCQSWKCELSQE